MEKETIFLWRRGKTEKEEEDITRRRKKRKLFEEEKGGNYSKKEINGDANQPTDRVKIVKSALLNVRK